MYTQARIEDQCVVIVGANITEVSGFDITSRGTYKRNEMEIVKYMKKIIE